MPDPTYKQEFPADCHPPAEWIDAIEKSGARDDSWRNDAAPSWIMDSGADHVTRFFYYTTAHTLDGAGAARVDIVTEYHERPEESFVCSPDAALTLARAIQTQGNFWAAMGTVRPADYVSEDAFWARYSRDVTDSGL